MIVTCMECKADFDDRYRLTFCPHDTFMANDGKNNFRHYPGSYLRTSAESPLPTNPDVMFVKGLAKLIVDKIEQCVRFHHHAVNDWDDHFNETNAILSQVMAKGRKWTAWPVGDIPSSFILSPNGKMILIDKDQPRSDALAIINEPDNGFRNGVYEGSREDWMQRAQTAEAKLFLTPELLQAMDIVEYAVDDKYNPPPNIQEAVRKLITFLKGLK